MLKRSLMLSLIGVIMFTAGCGGALQDRKQQVTVGVTPNSEITLNPGERQGLTASARAYDEPLTSMRWSIEPVTLPAVGPTPTITNMNCTNATLTIKDKDGIGRCNAEVSIPATAEPMTWRIGMLATAQSKGTAAASFVLKVVAPERDNGNFRIDAPALVSTNADGTVLLSNQLVTIDARALSDYPISGLSYEWQLRSSQTVVLAGAKTARLQFVPRQAGEYQFTVTARGTIGGREEVVSADVLVVVEDSDRIDELVVFAGNAQSIEAGELVTLTGQATYNGTVPGNPTYSWKQIGGLSVVMANPNSATPTFFAPMVTEDTELEFELTMTAVINGRTVTGKAVTVVRVEVDA